MQSRRRLAATGLAVLLYGAQPVTAEPAPSLRAAASFAVLGESAVANSGATTVTGNLGVSAGSVSGAPVVELGRVYTNDALTQQAQADNAAAYRELSTLPCTHDLTGQNLGGQILTEGVYCFSSSAALTGILVLDARGRADAVWVFRVPGTLTTARGSSVLVAGGGFDGHVFWQVAGSATLGDESAFIGNILALNGIAFGHGARLSGRALTQQGAVTLDGNRVSLCCSPLTIAPAALPGGTVGTPYSQTISAAGGLAEYTFVHSSGTLPDPVTVFENGVIAGTPGKAGTFRFTVTARDARGCESSAAYEVTIECPAITIYSPDILGPATVGKEYVLPQFKARGGTDPYTYTYTFMPPTTLPVEEGPIVVTVTATDVNGCTGTRKYTIEAVCPIITIDSQAPLPNGKVGEEYVLPLFTATPEDRSYVFTISPSPIPTTTPGLIRVTVTATDPYGCFGTRVYEPRICPVITISPAVLPPATLNELYDPPGATIGASGGSGSYTFTIAGLPAGLGPQVCTMSSGCTITGTPTKTGIFVLTVTVVDTETSCTAMERVTLIVDPREVDCSTVAIVNPDLANGTLGAEYHDVLTAAGGTGPYTFTQVTGSLPPHVTLSSGGTLSGPADALGSYTLEATVTDATPCTSKPRCFTIDIQPPACEGTNITLSPLSVSDALVGMPYSETITADGGTSPYTFSITAGVLPPGLTLGAATGAITGIPTTPGTYDFTITATDANGCLGSRCYVIRVAAGIPMVEGWGIFVLAALLASIGVVLLRRVL